MNSAARPPANAGRQRNSPARRGPPPKASVDPRVPADALLPFCSFAAAMAGFSRSSLDPRLSLDL